MLKRLVILVLLGLPFAASADTAPPTCTDHFLGVEMPNVSPNRARKTRFLCFSEYAVLHSALTKTPVWSAERLTSERIEAAAGVPRKNAFHAEQRLAPNERAELADYKESGFDRGHMAPAGDMSTPKAKRESFSLANMIPQHPCNNEELWEGIESAVRQLVVDEDEVYVVTGPVYPSSAELKQIGDGVIIPTHVFKAIYVPTINGAAAYVTPNTDGKEWKGISLNDLNKLIDVDIFPKLPQSVKNTAMKLPDPLPPKFRCRLRN